MSVAALYVDPRGPYPSLVADWYDLARDARTYAGPHPVIAHPPCGPWGRLRGMSKGDHRDCAIIAVEQVRTWRGVLEHPAYSSLWFERELPPPGQLWPDEFGGRTYEITQGEYGHVAPKLTWLYAVGLAPCPLRRGWGHQSGRVELQHSSVRHLTPPDLAQRLVQWVSA